MHSPRASHYRKNQTFICSPRAQAATQGLGVTGTNVEIGGSRQRPQTARARVPMSAFNATEVNVNARRAELIRQREEIDAARARVEDELEKTTVPVPPAAHTATFAPSAPESTGGASTRGAALRSSYRRTYGGRKFKVRAHSFLHHASLHKQEQGDALGEERKEERRGGAWRGGRREQTRGVEMIERGERSPRGKEAWSERPSGREGKGKVRAVL